MPKFIEVHTNGKKVLVNLLWVEEVIEASDGGAEIYLAFNIPNALEQDYVFTDESYSDVLKMIWA